MGAEWEPYLGLWEQLALGVSLILIVHRLFMKTKTISYEQTSIST